MADAPRRKSVAGPMLSAGGAGTFGGLAKNFAVTNTYVRGHERGVEGMLKAVTANEELVFDGNINIVSAIETTKDILCCKYTEDFECLAVGFTDGMVRLFKTNTAECVQTMFDLETQQNTAPATCIQHRPVSKNYPITNCLTCTYANGCVKCWNYNFGQCIYTIREKRQTFGVTYHPRLPKFVTYGDDLKIYLYDEESRTQERILSSEAPGTADGHVSRIFAACFNPRSNHEFITGGWDDVVQFWDLRQPHALRRLSGLHICGEGLDISAKGTEILTCAWQRENPLQLWDYGSGELIVTIEPDIHESLLYCGKYINKDYILVGGTDKNIVRVVDLHSYTTASSINGLPGGIYCVDLGPLKKSKKVKIDVPKTKAAELMGLPRMAFVSGKKVYQIDHV
ncbi:hypothetical protein ILUMI_10417 [Ignelater luminosus]|uniref:Uncharacterized protein n=1 Tax=Ignelater luminosus TaxID=2038154 RepID=A0A8K0D2G7_IGNLU|nr:hypothetical protein ILUMI_10417 [Ignelater luminosus]